MKLFKNALYAFLFLACLNQLNAETPVEKKEVDPKKAASVTLYNETFAGTMTIKRLKELLAQGADLNHEEPDGTRPLDQAFLTRNNSVAQEMQKHGAKATQSGLHFALRRLQLMHGAGATVNGILIIKDFKKSGAQISDDIKKALKIMHANAMYICKHQATKPANHPTLAACDEQRLISLIFTILDIKPDETIEVVRVS